MATWLNEVRRVGLNSPDYRGSSESDESIKIKILLRDSFYAKNLIEFSGPIRENSQWVRRYARQRLESQFVNPNFYLQIRNISVIKRDNESDLYVSYDVYLKKDSKRAG